MTKVHFIIGCKFFSMFTFSSHEQINQFAGSGTDWFTYLSGTVGVGYGRKGQTDSWSGKKDVV